MNGRTLPMAVFKVIFLRVTMILEFHASYCRLARGSRMFTYCICENLKGFAFSFLFIPLAWKTVGGLCNSESICVCVCVGRGVWSANGEGSASSQFLWWGVYVISVTRFSKNLGPDAIDIQGQGQYYFMLLPTHYIVFRSLFYSIFSVSLVFTLLLHTLRV